MRAVVSVVQRRQTPLIASKHLSGLQYPVDLRVYILPNGGVASRLDGIHTVKVVVWEGQLHEVGLNGQGPLLGQQPCSRVQLVPSDDLILRDGGRRTMMI